MNDSSFVFFWAFGLGFLVGVCLHPAIKIISKYIHITFGLE